MVFDQKPRKPIMFTANAHKNAQGYCQPNKASICYNLPLHTHDEDQFPNNIKFRTKISSEQHTNPSPRTGPQDLLVTHYDCEENEQKTLHKYAINQVTQCESEPQAI